MDDRYVFDFKEINKSKPGLVGGKGWNLGRLFRIEGINVPDGFCITTEAYRTAIEHNEEFTALVSQLATFKAEDRISEISARVRGVIEGSEITKEIECEIPNFSCKIMIINVKWTKINNVPNTIIYLV